MQWRRWVPPVCLGILVVLMVFVGIARNVVWFYWLVTLGLPGKVAIGVTLLVSLTALIIYCVLQWKNRGAAWREGRK